MDERVITMSAMCLFLRRRAGIQETHQQKPRKNALGYGAAAIFHCVTCIMLPPNVKSYISGRRGAGFKTVAFHLSRQPDLWSHGDLRGSSGLFQYLHHCLHRRRLLQTSV